jgi:hypothetical protein
LNLANAAKAFDNLLCADAYNPGTTFYGQFDTYNDSIRDSVTTSRSILSTAPSVTIPARHAVTFLSDIWILGNPQIDYFKNAPVRVKYVAHGVTSKATVKTFAEALAGSAGFTAYAGRQWVKATKEIDVSSGMYDEFEIYFASTESIPDDALIQLDGYWNLARTSFPSATGLLTVVCDELPAPVLETGAYLTATYDPVADTTSTASAALQVLRFRWQSHFKYPTLASHKFERGDLNAFVLKSAVTAKAGDLLSLSDGDWRILSVIDYGLTWGAHIRHV